jgi:hypothetical protein
MRRIPRYLGALGVVLTLALALLALPVAPGQADEHTWWPEHRELNGGMGGYVARNGTHEPWAALCRATIDYNSQAQIVQGNPEIVPSTIISVGSDTEPDTNHVFAHVAPINNTLAGIAIFDSPLVHMKAGVVGTRWGVSWFGGGWTPQPAQEFPVNYSGYLTNYGAAYTAQMQSGFWADASFYAHFYESGNEPFQMADWADTVTMPLDKTPPGGT